MTLCSSYRKQKYPKQIIYQLQKMDAVLHFQSLDLRIEREEMQCLLLGEFSYVVIDAILDEDLTKEIPT